MSSLHALLLTDVVDSTQLTETLGDAAMARLWTVHDRVARDLLPLWRGREIDKTDGMLLLFDDVRDAVGYALAYHRALAARELPFKARAGIHVGRVTLRPNPPEDVARGAKPIEVDGLALPITARVMSVALGAQTLLSADARLALGVAEQRVISHGHWRMHGVADPVELFEIGDAGEAPFTAPPDGAKVYRVMRQGDLWQPVREVRHSVPAERDSFVGREEPLQLLATKFEEGARLVSVLGMGGTGKTRLVTRYAWTVLGDHPGGVWFCDLSQARTVDGIHFAVAQGLDVPLGKTDPVVQLARAIAGRGKCLVILDNFEQVARHAEETLGHWLERAPLAQFIVTTREVLGIVGEETLALDPLGPEEATSLFMRRIESANSAYRPSDEDQRAIEQLVRVLDGLPLAIELAAARGRAMSPRMMLARMDERFRLLLSNGGRRDRQSTLRAAFDWSWELLSEHERAALAQLSVFEGGFTLAAAQAVIDFSPLAAGKPWADDVVLWLVDKSFVRRLADDRFDMLESVRDYAAEHLRTPERYHGSGPQARLAAESRHGAYFAQPAGTSAVPWGLADLNNAVVACKRASARGDGAIALRTLVASWSRLQLCGPFRVGVELVKLVRSIGPLGEADRAELELTAGATIALCGVAADAERHYLDAVARARAIGNTDIEARAVGNVARLQAQQGRVSAAESSFEQALSLARINCDSALECGVLNHLGTFCESLGRFDEAHRHYDAALKVARHGSHRRWEGGCMGNLGQFLANQGQMSEARPLYTQALSIARELGDRQWEANARCNLGLLHYSEGRLDDARLELEAALSTARALGHVRLASIVLCNLGLVAEAVGDRPVEAGSCYEEAVEIACHLRDHRSEGQFLTYLGLFRARQSRFAEARGCLDRAAELLDRVSDQVSLGIMWCSRSEAERLAGDSSAAATALSRAEVIATTLGNIHPASEFGLALHRVRIRDRIVM